MTLGIIIGVAFGRWLTERLWAANDLPRVRAWYPRDNARDCREARKSGT